MVANILMPKCSISTDWGQTESISKQCLKTFQTLVQLKHENILGRGLGVSA